MREREKDEYFGCENSRMCLICFSLHFSLAVCIRVDFGAMKKHSLALNTPLSVDDTDFVSVAFQFFWKHWTLFTASLTWHNIYLAAAAAVATRDRKKCHSSKINIANKLNSSFERATKWTEKEMMCVCVCWNCSKEWPSEREKSIGKGKNKQHQPQQ